MTRPQKTRMETIGDCTLYLGDCMDVMPTLGRVDAVVTDPPYGLGDWNNRGSNKNRPFNSDFTQSWDRAPTASIMELIKEVSRWQIIWGANYLLDHLGRTKQMLIWNKGIRKMHFNDCEIAWASGWKEASRVIDLHPSAVEKKEHPTQKPLEVMRWCIGQLPDAAETICDPFMGSGTTGVSCVNLGRRFIGIEIERKYFDIACKRIEEAYRQPRLFEEPKPQPVQESFLEAAE